MACAWHRQVRLAALAAAKHAPLQNNKAERKSRTKPSQGQRNVLCKENVLQPGRLQQAFKEVHERVQQLPDAPPGLEVPQ